MKKQLPENWKLKSLFGDYYVVDEKGFPFKCARSKERAVRYALAGRRPDSKVTLPGL